MTCLFTEDDCTSEIKKAEKIGHLIPNGVYLYQTLYQLVYILFQEQRIHPGAPIDVSLSPTPSEIARLPSGSDTGKESTLDDLLDALQSYPNSEGGSNTDSIASETPELGMFINN